MQRRIGAHNFKAVVPIAEADHAFGFEQLQQFFPNRAVGDAVQRRFVLHDEGQVKDFELADAHRAKF